MIRGQKQVLKKEVPHIHKEMKFSIHNRFDVEVIDAVTGEVKQKVYAENVVLDALWTRLLAPNSYFNYIHFGTGTGTPVASRTSLFTFLGAKAATDKTQTYKWDEGWVSSRKQIQLDETENVDSELTEVGIGYGSSSTNLVTHALLKDMNGNTITIVKTSTDIIIIYATIFIHFNKDGYDNGSIKVFACEGNRFVDTYLAGDGYTIYPLLMYYKGNPQFDFYYDTPSQSWSKVLANTEIPLTFSASTKKISMNSTRLSAVNGNALLAGIKSIALAFKYAPYSGGSSYGGCPAVAFMVPGTFYPKSTIAGEAIATGDGSTKDFSTDFPFVNSGAKIYVNGEEQISGVTVDIGRPLTNNNLGAYFEFVSGKFTSASSGYGYPPSFDYQTNAGLARMTDYTIWYNKLYNLGIKSLKYQAQKIEVSDDMITWTTLIDDSSTSIITLNIPTEHQNKKYWKIQNKNTTYSGCNTLTSDFDTTNIHFTTAPVSGALITADYECEVIAKDANHVFDFSFEITLAEKTV